jgi:hypothetical protein
VGVEASREGQDSPAEALLDQQHNPASNEREAMFYVVLIVIAAILAVALFYMRGRTSA